MIEIEVHSDGIAAESALGFALALVGNVGWKRRTEPPGRAQLLIYADAAPLEALANAALRFTGESRRPIVVVSDPAPEAQIAQQLHAGVDLCLPMETNGWYLVAAVGALARRIEPAHQRPDVESALVEATAASTRRLTRLQTELLRYLVSKRGRWISKEELSIAVLGHPPRGYDDSTLRVHLSRVRRLLGDRGQLIQSRRQRGWRWAEPAPIDQHL